MLHIAHRLQFLNNLIKVTLIGGFLAVIGYKLLYAQDLASMWHELTGAFTSGRIWIVAVVILLMPLNWILEVFKWQLLMKPAYKMNLATAVKAVLSGVTISLFTPNRIGEYGGRVLFVPARYNWRAVLATLVGSFSQNLVHIAFGLAALLWYTIAAGFLPVQFEKGLVVLLGVVLVILFVIYFNLAPISRWLDRIEPAKILEKPWRALRHLQRITVEDLGLALGYAGLRYIIFSTQFLLLMVFFDVGVPVYWIAAGIAIIYLLQTSIPLPPFVDVVARSELAIILWINFEVNELAVVSASFFLWIINLVVPAFFGMLALSKVDVLQSLGYEENSQMASHRTVSDHGSGVRPVIRDDP